MPGDVCVEWRSTNNQHNWLWILSSLYLITRPFHEIDCTWHHWTPSLMKRECMKGFHCCAQRLHFSIVYHLILRSVMLFAIHLLLECFNFEATKLQVSFIARYAFCFVHTMHNECLIDTRISYLTCISVIKINLVIMLFLTECIPYNVYRHPW